MRLALAVVALALLAVPAAAAPTREHPLDDAAQVVPDADEPALETELAELRATGVDLAVIVVTSTGGTAIETYARTAAKRWATGTTPAAVLVLAIKDRKSRLEVSDPLRGTFPDARAQSILDNIKGYLRSADYTGAIRAVIAEVKAGVAGVAPDLESPHPQVPDPSAGNTAFDPPLSTTTPPAPPPGPSPSYEAPKRPINWTAIVGAVLLGGLLIGGANLWARSRIASRATLSANGTITSDRGIVAETLWCMMLILGGVLYIAAIVFFTAAAARTNSSSSWGSFRGGSSSGGSGFRGGSSSGGWSGGGASSSW